ncbi:MAG: hypothetical protein QG641_2269, partial [Candidatus Poribacteria bacterium]|nr:hypothetical protein [Candidatus Poribacteria bacterium]
LTICLTQEQQKQLEQIRDTDKSPYMRECSAAILKRKRSPVPIIGVNFCQQKN